MAYIDYEYYLSQYGDDAIDENQFNRQYSKAESRIDNAVLSLDGVNKLEVAFPTKEKDARKVKSCICEIINKLSELDAARKAVKEASGYTEDNGLLYGKVVTSISSGSESLGLSAKASVATWTDKALADSAILDAEIRDIIKNGLSGVFDANGVPLLSGSVYPVREVITWERF